MRKVPFVRKPDELAFATSHLAQSSSASRVTRRTSRILLPVGEACPCISLTPPATVIFWTADLSVTRPRLGWSRPAGNNSPSGGRGAYAIYGYEGTREAVTAAFAKSWRRE